MDTATAPTAPATPTAPPPLDARPAPPVTPRRRGVATAAMVAGLVAALTTYGLLRFTDLPQTVAATQPAPQAQARTDATAPAPRSWEAAIARDVEPSVAEVTVTTPQGQGEGSAVIYRSDGYLLTNNHVAANATELTVTLPSGKDYPATIVGTDAATDLAVIRIEATGLPAATLATADPQVGEQVLAIGTPFGLSGTVTEGIVSAIGRTVPEPTTALTNMLQTDAAINPGNSGGALVNDAGQVIGINTAILSPSGTNNGIGFAIPIATARNIAEQLITHGSVEHGYLGIAGQTVDPRVASVYHLGVDHGAVVAQVQPGSGAADAGLQPGDIITSVDDHAIASMEELTAALVQHSPGDTIRLEVYRDGQAQQIRATLGRAPTRQTTTRNPTNPLAP